MVPMELSVKDTVSGAMPLVGVAVKLARGTRAPAPVTRFVLLPLPVVVNTAALLKLLMPGGANRTTTLVTPKPGREKGEPERIVKGPVLRETTPLDSGALPVLVTVKLACLEEPTATKPKFSVAGDTAS
jgi:hypothetical protein